MVEYIPRTRCIRKCTECIYMKISFKSILQDNSRTRDWDILITEGKWIRIQPLCSLCRGKHSEQLPQGVRVLSDGICLSGGSDSGCTLNPSDAADAPVNTSYQLLFWFYLFVLSRLVEVGSPLTAFPLLPWWSIVLLHLIMSDSSN